MAKQKIIVTPNAGEDAEKPDTAAGNVKGDSRRGKQFVIKPNMKLPPTALLQLHLSQERPGIRSNKKPIHERP